MYIGGYGILNSPRLLNSDCVFVLVGVIVESYGKTTRSSVDPGMYPLGTAFAIKTNACVHLLTAYHTIEQNSKCTKWYVTSKVSRNANGTWNWNANELISVKLLDFDKGNDVALLCSDKVFPKDGLITICRQNEITKVADECLFKTYYCPLDDIISQPSFPPLAASPSENKKMYAISDSHMWLYGGLCGGSSGGVVVNRAGAAVGMHVASDSQALSVQDVKNNDAQEGKCLRRDDDSVYSESSYSCANSHSSVQVIVLLPNIDLLRSLF